MSVHDLSRHYGSLKPDERFRLILAASGRHDDVEQQKLISSGRRIEHSVQDHSPYAHAFDEICKIAYLGLLEAVACSPKADPCGMRVPKAHLGDKETLDERQEASPGADHQEAA